MFETALEPPWPSGRMRKAQAAVVESWMNLNAVQKARHRVWDPLSERGTIHPETAPFERPDSYDAAV
jgi:hypothetical protein